MQLRQRKSLIFASLLFFVIEVDARPDVDPPKRGPEQTHERFIVQLSYPPLALFDASAASRHAKLQGFAPVTLEQGRLPLDSAAAKRYRAAVSDQQQQILRALEHHAGSKFVPIHRLDVVLNALVLDLTPAQARWLAQQPQVVRVEADWIARPATDAGPGWIGADTLWGGSAGATTRGEGVVVGIIDTGINASHPSFAATGPLDSHVHGNPLPGLVTICNGGNSPCNNKLIGIRDFTSGTSSAEPDNGLDVDGHGSHVAATAAGNALQVSLSVGASTVVRTLSGVAPHANLISYKACEQEADCLGSWLLAAINAAVADGVDVINYSIGGDARSPWTASDAQAMAAARAAGVVVVVSAGNDGPSEGSLTSPANAPWVLAVANATHNRTLGSRLLDFVGGTSSAPGGGSLLGAGSTTGYGPASIVIPQDFPTCGMGDGLGLGADGQPDGSSNPWAGQPARFNGEIVICLRGTQARVAKGDNVRRAGAGGMVLINGVLDGESIVADSHVLPATHLGFADGETLRQWLGAGGQNARIEGARLVVEDSLGDRLAASSGRGPVDFGGVLKPNLTAPGTSILAAAGTGNGIATLSGTSMAAPHVTGAAALVRAARPSWTVSQIESALQTTAVASVRLSDGVTAATAWDAGAGRVNLGDALRGGLYLEIGSAEFQAANPASGGSPRQLNLPAIVLDECGSSCGTQRRVRDQIGGGRWRVESQIADGSVVVTPSEFTLSGGASQVLDIRVNLADVAVPGRWIEGEVRLLPVGGSAAATRIPIAALAELGTVSTGVYRDVLGDAGFVDLPVDPLFANFSPPSAPVWLAYSLPEMHDAHFSALEWQSPQIEALSLAADPTPDAVFDGFATGVAVRTLRIPAASGAVSTWKVIVQTASPSATDVDLYVGNDINGDGLPAEGETICESTSGSATERCEIAISQTGSAQTIWILVQNWRAGSSGLDVVNLDMLQFDSQGPAAAEVVVSGPAQTLATDTYPVRLAWNDPSWLPGESRRTVLALRTRPTADPYAHVPVTLTRPTSDTSAARGLQSGQALSLRLAPGQAHERLFIDVPAGSTGLQVTQTGTGNVQMFLARDGSGSGPAIPAAPPRSAAVVSHTGSGANANLQLPVTPLTEGRWYLTPVNTDASSADIVIQATLTRTSPMATPRHGAFYNPARSGSGLFLFPLGEQWGVIWYTYLEDGSPTWYIAAAAKPAGNAPVWVAPITRHVWNGVHDRPGVVGSMRLSVIDANHLQFGFDVDGVAGSETLSALPLPGCTTVSGQTASLDGFWYDPTFAGFGYSIVAGSAQRSVAAYLYDRSGIARWMLGAAGGTDNRISMLQFSGFCPTCSYVPVLSAGAGSLVLAASQPNAAQFTLGVEWLPPLQGRWSVDHAVIKLGDNLSCTP